MQAYAYDTGVGCMTWSGDLIDVQKFPSGGVDVHIRIPKQELGELFMSSICMSSQIDNSLC